MGVFLSKPCVDKFSEDGADDAVGFGVSSMQGWRRNMEDAHVAQLNLPTEIREDADEEGKVRIFGVFDGHGGKEVALFVQEHIAEELVKLEEYRNGDFAGALTRSFHRMDELLEEAAAEMRLSKNGDGGSSGSDPDGEGLAGTKGYPKVIDDTERSEEVRARARAAMHELSSFRARKNPSDIMGQPPSPSGANSEGRSPEFALKAKAIDEDDFEMEGSFKGSDSGNGDDEAGSTIQRDGTERAKADEISGDTDIMDGADDRAASREIEIGKSGDSGAGGGGGDAEASVGERKIKMADALALFHRILDIRKEFRTDTEDAREATEGDHTDGRQSTDAEEASQGGDGSLVVGAPAFSDASISEGVRAGGVGRETGEFDLGEGVEDDTEGDDLSASADESVRPRLGLGASLASVVAAGPGPTCNLRDHPIQAGCTSVVCLMVGNTLYVANAGDSRAVMCRGGVALDLSKDHKPLADSEKSRIEGAGGFVNTVGRVNGNLNLSRSIGDLKYKANPTLEPSKQIITAEPDVRTVEMAEGDRFLVLACDGVWDCMTSQECVDFIGERIGKMALSKVCEEVMDRCLSENPRQTTGIGGDNMTCIVVALDKHLVREQEPSSTNEGNDPESDAKPSSTGEAGTASETS